MLRKCGNGLKLAAVLAAASFGSGALAEQALIIANYAYNDAANQTDVRARAEDVSETLFGLGYAVTRLENPTVGRVQTAIDGLAAQTGPVVVYYAGRSAVEGEQTQLMMTDDGSLILDDLLADAGAGTRDMTAVFLDVCLEPEDLAVVEELDEDPVETDDVVVRNGLGALPNIDGVLLAAATQVGTACAPTEQNFTDAMLDRLSVPGLAVDALFEDTAFDLASSLDSPFVFRPVRNGMRLTAEDYDRLDSLSPEAQEQMLALWAASGIAVDREGTSAPSTSRMVTNETVVLTSPLRPVNTGGATLSPIAPTVSRVQDGISLAPRGATPIQASASTSRAVPGAGGLPRPSIIVGLIAPTEASFDTAIEPLGPVAGSAIEYTDLEGRRSLRESDPDLFASLVDGGAFDPPEVELIRALQTELGRMNCYNSTIDGLWGPGSRAAVGRYYEQLDAASPSQDADVSIFRQIMKRDEVTCPAVARVAAPPPHSTPRATTPRATAQPRAATPQPAAPAQTAQPAAPSRTINRSSGTGIFR